jgi:TolB-like protein
VAVLYFENLSASKDDEYFRDGMTEDIITELSKITELQVFPRAAVYAYRDKPITGPQVGHELHAACVLTGSLRRAGNRLRITAQLVQTHSGHSIWAERYDRELKDVFEVQDEIARSISQALRIKLSPQEEKAITRRPTESAQAYDYYLRGRQYFYQWRRKSFDFARQMFARAIVIDPGYARAYAGVADCCSIIYTYYESSEDNLNEADAATRKALELDPELAEAHASRGLALALSKNFQGARTEFETAIRLNPKLFEAYYFYARASFQQGMLVEAAELYELACRINPDDYQAPSLLSTVYHGLGESAKAEVTQQRALPNFTPMIREPSIWARWRWLVWESANNVLIGPGGHLRLIRKSLRFSITWPAPTPFRGGLKNPWTASKKCSPMGPGTSIGRRMIPTSILCALMPASRLCSGSTRSDSRY